MKQTVLAILTTIAAGVATILISVIVALIVYVLGEVLGFITCYSLLAIGCFIIIKTF